MAKIELNRYYKRDNVGNVIKMQDIADEIMKKWDITEAELFGEGWNRIISKAREELVFRCRKELGKTFNEISPFMCKDRSTTRQYYTRYLERFERTNGEYYEV